MDNIRNDYERPMAIFTLNQDIILALELFKQLLANFEPLDEDDIRAANVAEAFIKYIEKNR